MNEWWRMAITYSFAFICLNLDNVGIKNNFLPNVS